MSGYRFGLICPKCGGRMRHTADGVSTPRATCALAECADCRAMWRIDVRLACVREPMPQLPSLDDEPVVWDETAPMAGLIRLLLDADDGSGSADSAEKVAQEACHG